MYFLTISKHFWLFSINSRTILDYLGLSWCILVYLGLSWAILDYLGLSRTISNYPGLSQTISDYRELSLTNSDYLGQSLTILDHLGLSQTIIAIWNFLVRFFFTWASSRGARALKNIVVVNSETGGDLAKDANCQFLDHMIVDLTRLSTPHLMYWYTVFRWLIVNKEATSTGAAHYLAS